MSSGMWKLLRAVEAALKQRLDPSLIRPQDIFIAADQLDLPTGVRLPAIGIKDGGRQVTQMGCNVDRSEVTVDLTLWCPSGAGDAQVMGDTTQPGVLDFEETHVEPALRGNTLGVARSGGWLLSSAASREVVNETSGIVAQVRVLTFQYFLEKSWE
jgi:hypothetical protein